MKKLSLILLIISFNLISAQKDYKLVMAETIENYDYYIIDSIAKMNGFKAGQKIKTSVTFKVNHIGEAFEISGEAPHEIFVEENIKIIESLPKLKFDVPLKNGQHFKFKLPITYNLMTKRELKKLEKNKKK